MEDLDSTPEDLDSTSETTRDVEGSLTVYPSDSPQASGSFHINLSETPPKLDSKYLKRRTADTLEAAREPIRGVGLLLNRRLTLNLSGTAIVVCQNQVVLSVLALAALRSIGIWSWLDPHYYAVIACIAAVVSAIAVLSYFIFYSKSGKDPDGQL